MIVSLSTIEESYKSFLDILESAVANLRYILFHLPKLLCRGTD